MHEEHILLLLHWLQPDKEQTKQAPFESTVVFEQARQKV